MAISFKPLKLDDPDLFGVGVEGSVGRSDRTLLEELADKCLARTKTRIILDFSTLETIGGGGAATLADFQRNLVEQGGEAVFAGVADLVHKFLVQKFDDLPLRCYPSVDDAVTDFHNCGQAESVDCSTAPGGAAGVDRPGTDCDLDSLLGGVQDDGTAASEPATPEPAADAPDAAAPAAAGPGQADAANSAPCPAGGGDAGAHQFLSLDEAVAALRAATDGTALRDSLARLLHGYGLADEVTYFVFQDGRYVSSDGAWSIASDGQLAFELAGADRPLSLLDITQDLGEEDTLPLAELQPDLILPVVWDQTLQAVAFLKRTAAEGREYEISEHFALELVMRLLSDHGGRGPLWADAVAAGSRTVAASPPDRCDAPDTDPEEDRAERAVDGPTDAAAVAAETDDRLAGDEAGESGSGAEAAAGDPQSLREPAVLPTLFALARDLPFSDESERFWKLFVERVSGLYFVRSLIYLAPDRFDAPVACLGRARSGVAQLDLTDERLTKYFANLQRPVQVPHLPASFAAVRDELQRLGIDWIASLSLAERRLGLVLLGLEPRIERDDQTDLVEEVLAVTTQALALLSERQRGSDLRCDLLRTVIGLYEHHDRGAAERTAMVARLLPLLARKVDFPADQRRELMCGVLLADIGRIEHCGCGSLAGEHDDEDLPQDRDHPESGAELLAQLEVSPTVTEVVSCHHERFDGAGFPSGRQGREIPLAARIAAVVVTYVNLVSGNGDTAAMDPAEAAHSLRGFDPGRLDPEIVDALATIVDEVVTPVAAC